MPSHLLGDVAERLMLLRVQVTVVVAQIESRFARGAYEVFPGVGALLLVRHIRLSEFRALWVEAEAARLKEKRHAVGMVGVQGSDQRS